MEIIREILEDDYVKLGKRKFRFNTLPYWFVRIGQGVFGAIWVYVIYIAVWLLFGGI